MHDSKLSFEDMLDEISYIFDTGQVKGRMEKGAEIKEVGLCGQKAFGAGYRVKQSLAARYNIVNVTSNGQTIADSEQPTILYIDLRDFDTVPDRFRELAREKNVKLLVVDVGGRKYAHLQDFSYSFSNVDYFLRESDADIDRAISRTVAELYSNVDFAVRESVTLADGKTVKPYFKTSVLIDYPRSRDILEGIISSVIRKFEPHAIASRDVSGQPPEDDVKMYDLAKPIAEKLGLGAARIVKQGDIYAVERDMLNEKVLLLEDVVGSGETKLKLAEAVDRARGSVTSCVVLLDRMEGAESLLNANKIGFYALTDLETYNSLATQKK